MRAGSRLENDLVVHEVDGGGVTVDRDPDRLAVDSRARVLDRDRDRAGGGCDQPKPGWSGVVDPVAELEGPCPDLRPCVEDDVVRPGCGQDRSRDGTALAEALEVRIEVDRQAGIAGEVVLVTGEDDMGTARPEMTATPKFATAFLMCTR